MRSCLLAVLATAALAAAGSAAAETDVVPRSLPGPAATDTVRSNLFLVEALMSDVVRQTAAVLPPAPASVLLHQRGKEAQDEVLTDIFQHVLSARGYDLYLQTPPPPAKAGQEQVVKATPQADYVIRYQVTNIGLDYPESARTLGIWRRWVARDLELSVSISVQEEATGRLLMSDRLDRRYQDRVPDDLFPAVRSRMYPFTDADVEGSGWGRRLEEIVVLGTLSGLVAIYFANTGN